MATRQNLIDTYNANPTLQVKYTLPQYLALFDFSQTTTPTQTPTTTPTQTPATPGIPNIINQNINQGGGGDGGPQGIATIPGTYQKEVIGVMPDGSPMFSGYKKTEGPGIIDSLKNTADDLFGLYQKFSPIGMIGKAIQDRKDFKQAQTNKALEQIEMQKQIREAEAQAAALANAQRTGRRPSAPTGGGQQDSGGPTGGYSYDSGGREGFGYGLADGGKVKMADMGDPNENAEYHSQRLFGKPYKKLTADELEEFQEEMRRLMSKFMSDGGRVYLYNRLK